MILASALAQSAGILILDEPTTFLDLQHQVGLYRLLRDLCRQGMLVLAVTHDINLAASYADRVLLLKQGRIIDDGPPERVIATESIRNVFSIDARVEVGENQRPWVHYGG